MLEIDFMQSTQEAEPLRDPVIPKDLARKFIESKPFLSSLFQPWSSSYLLTMARLL
jgi:hypothetical protein